ncbi:PREDICTED: phosphoserine phosphatase, chloroplastic-like [Lupinus angustifolius]|uniref:phosphoserine phosphatase, chloroplastic-like n=1 Tax=Lupinus angustifolius TaxID=3871 RepID=UPI00092F7448|nr:PREDICTED: phosphoserine phosphatase, chloroplastic-like [Lupinus angustifolius]
MEEQIPNLFLFTQVSAIASQPNSHHSLGMKHSRPLHITASVRDSTQNFHNNVLSKESIELWRNVNAVCFDVDSTVCIDEDIDELALFCGAGNAVAQLTASAMGCSVPFEEALAARLSLFNLLLLI